MLSRRSSSAWCCGHCSSWCIACFPCVVASTLYIALAKQTLLINTRMNEKQIEFTLLLLLLCLIIVGLDPHYNNIYMLSLQHNHFFILIKVKKVTNRALFRSSFNCQLQLKWNSTTLALLASITIIQI
jgi:tryptophanyl-tRNA synthetase